MLTDIERIYSSLLDRKYQERLFGDLDGFEKKGSGYIARCPFHEDVHPTLVIYGDRPEYFCFACSARGDWLGYIQRKERVGFHESLSRLCKVSGIEANDYDPVRWNMDRDRSTALEQALGLFNAQLFAKAGEQTLHYLYKRRYTMSEVEGSSFGYYPGFVQMRDYLISQGFAPEKLDKVLNTIWNREAEHCSLVIPFRDSCGRLMGLYGRDIVHTGQEAYSPLTDLGVLKDIPFLMYRSRHAEELIVLEGLLDALLIDRIGIKPVIAIGKDGLTRNQTDVLCEYGIRHCIICLGSTGRRKRATIDAAQCMMERGIKVSVLPLDDAYSDIDEFIRSNDLNRFRKLLEKPVAFEEWAEQNM